MKSSQRTAYRRNREDSPWRLNHRTYKLYWIALKQAHLSAQEDLPILDAAVRSQQITIATGDRAASIGGSAEGAVVITGNGNIVITGANAEAIRDLLGAMGSPPPQRGVSSDRSSQKSVAVSDSGRDREQPMDFKRQRWEKKFQTLQSEWNTRTDKLARIRDAFAIETNPAIKFQLEQQIQAEEAEIADLEEQLSEIEDTLNGGVQSQTEKK